MEVLASLWSAIGAPDRALESAFQGLAPGGALNAATLRFLVGALLALPLGLIHRYLYYVRIRIFMY